MSAKASPSKQAKEKAEQERREAQIAKALSHPLRTELLRLFDPQTPTEARHHLLAEAWDQYGGISPNVASKALVEPLTNVSYHVRMLHDLDCIEPVDEQARRGALEHYYRATVRPSIAFEAIEYEKPKRKKS